MNLSGLAFASASILIVSVLAVGLIVAKPALAQVDATSTETVAPSSEPATPVDAISDTSSNTETVVATEESISRDGETAAPSDAASPTESSSATPTEPRPEGLTEVQIIGIKYIDYFTDGVTEYSFPGDSEIHAHIAEKNAPSPLLTSPHA